MNIIPDPLLVALQALPFFTMLAALHFILFKPMLAYLAARRAATAGARAEAERLQEKAGLKLQQWEAALARAHAEVAEYRAERRAAAQAEGARQLAEARKKAEVRIADEVAVLQGEAALAREQVGRMARSLANDMASSVLGRSVVTGESA